MPEVVEVHHYADFIRKKCKNQALQDILILGGRYKKHGPFEHYSSLRHRLPLRVREVQSHGKFMAIHLESSLSIGFTLGLTGGWLYQTSAQQAKDQFTFVLDGTHFSIEDALEDSSLKRMLAHINVAFVFDHGILYFCDQLSFGTIKVFLSPEEVEAKIGKVGTSVLGDSFTQEQFGEILDRSKNQHKKIGLLLMDQTQLGGIGNYLRSDILWMAKISPHRKVEDLTETEVRRLYKAIILLVWGSYDRSKAIRMHKISRRDKLPDDYDRDFFVYQEKTDIHDNPVKKEALFMGAQKRYIYWVPEIQT